MVTRSPTQEGSSGLPHTTKTHPREIRVRGDEKFEVGEGGGWLFHLTVFRVETIVWCFGFPASRTSSMLSASIQFFAQKLCGELVSVWFHRLNQA